MKPYTLESYKAGKKAITRSGFVPDEIYCFTTAREFPFRMALGGEVWALSDQGRLSSNRPHRLDLFEQEELVEAYINVYKDYFGFMYSNIGDCINNSSAGLIETVKLIYDPNKEGDDRFSIEVVKQDSLA